MARKQKAPEIVHYCKDCKHATEDWQFENLSLNGRPTLLFCAKHIERKRLINERACGDFMTEIQ